MQIIAPTSIWFVVKIFFVIGLLVYFIFSLVIVRQIEIMTQTVKLEFELPIKILGILHLIFALVLLIFALIVL